jgi:hypothetical protein
MKRLTVQLLAVLGVIWIAQPVVADHPVLGDTQIHGAWHQSAWFGWFADDNYNWVLHAEHGSLYPLGSPASLLWYDLNLGDWIWTSPDLYPNIYKYTANQGWYWYNKGGTPSARWFFQLGTQRWMAENDLLQENPARGWHFSGYAFTDPSYSNKESLLAGTSSILVDNLWFEGDRGDLVIHHTRHDKQSGDLVASRTYQSVWSDPPRFIAEGSRPQLNLELKLIGSAGGWSAIPQHSVYWNQGWGAWFIDGNGTKFFTADMAARLEMDQDVTAGSPGLTRSVQVNLGESFVATYTYTWRN